MKIILLDHSREMTTQWQLEFANVDVEIVCDDFASFMNRRGNEIECVVSPANSCGLMDGGFDLALIRYFGEELAHAVQAYIREHYHGEQPVGTSFFIPIPNSDKFLIHTPTMRVPSPIYDWLKRFFLLTLIYTGTRGGCLLICARKPETGTGSDDLLYAEKTHGFGEKYLLSCVRYYNLHIQKNRTLYNDFTITG